LVQTNQVGPNPNLHAWAWALDTISPTHVVGPSPTHKLWACLARANFIKEIRPYLGSKSMFAKHNLKTCFPNTALKHS